MTDFPTSTIWGVIGNTKSVSKLYWILILRSHLGQTARVLECGAKTQREEQLGLWDHHIGAVRACRFRHCLLSLVFGQSLRAIDRGFQRGNRRRPIAVGHLARGAPGWIWQHRQTSGQGYQLLKDALRRLQGTQIETNIRQGGKEYFKLFGLIESAEIVRETRDGRMLDVEITLSDWVFDAIENNHVLTLNKQYFFLRKPLERRLYELARKHCGSQPKWKCGLELLRDKCGSGSTTKEFRRLLGKIIEDDGAHDHLPDYAMTIDGDNVVFRPKGAEAVVALPYRALRFSKPSTHDDARGVAPGWDIYALENEWRSWVHDKAIDVKDPDKHFLAFCKKRGAHRHE